jgi:hypothetical protein
MRLLIPSSSEEVAVSMVPPSVSLSSFNSYRITWRKKLIRSNKHIHKRFPMSLSAHTSPTAVVFKVGNKKINSTKYYKGQHTNVFEKDI